MTLSNTRQFTERVSEGITLPLYTIEQDGEVIEPEVVSFRKGPYTIHAGVIQTDKMFRVQEMAVEKNRPAILGPQRFADMGRVRDGNVNSLNELRAI